VRRYLSWFLSGCDALICPSLKSRRYFGILAPAVRAVVIENAADDARFRPCRLSRQEREQVRNAFGLDLSDRVILYAGRLGREKRVLELLHALAPLLSRGPHCKALFAGSGPLRETLLAAARRLGVERQVILTGPVQWEKMYTVYAIADLFVTASLSENHPMTCLEAMACGLPIVARRDESFAGLIQDGATGYLIDSDLALTVCAVHLLDDDAKRQAFSEKRRGPGRSVQRQDARGASRVVCISSSRAVARYDTPRRLLLANDFRWSVVSSGQRQHQCQQHPPAMTLPNCPAVLAPMACIRM